MDDSTFIFELLLRDNIFMDTIDKYILQVLINNKIEAKDIPQLVLSIVKLLQPKLLLYSNIDKTLRIESTYKLLDLYRNYIISKKMNNFHIKQFNDIYNTCVELLVMRLLVKDRKKLWCV